MVDRKAEVVWHGDLAKGNGELTLESSGVLKGAPVTWASRTEAPQGKTSPEELLAASHAECYVMGLAANLARRGTPPEQLSCTATATLNRGDSGFRVTDITLDVSGRVPGIDAQQFQEAAQAAEQGCPISNALRNNVQIHLQAHLRQ